MIVISALGVIHILTIGFVFMLSREPAKHLDDETEPHPRVYIDLLRATRWLLVLSYILVCALNPILPTRLEAIGADADAGARIASAWAISRLGVFLLMQRWHGWHGRWRTTIWAGGALAFGFALTVLATSVTMMIAGLAIFGVGVGGVYCAALYYAMEVGAAQVEAGGKHEALIGLGYTAGPFIGLVPWWAHSAGLLDAANIAPVIVGFAIVAGIVVFIGAMWPLRSNRLKQRDS
jgi:MFS family permease